MDGNNIYDILGVNENASASEIQSAYNRQRAEYSAKMFTAGPEGEQAAKRIDELDRAYAEAMGKVGMRSSGAGKTFGTDTSSETVVNPDEAFENGRSDPQEDDLESYYRSVEEQIKANNLVEAQKLLDEMDERTAEWHYLQSIVYYKKNWYLEAKKQLSFALNMEPNNPKYKSSMEKLTKLMSSKTINPEKFSSNDHSTYAPNSGAGMNNGTCTGTWCGDFCVANMCCNCASSCCCR